MQYTFEEAYKEIDEIYKRSGFGGMAEAADAGDEWAFIQNFNDGERLLGEHPLFFHKETEIIRRMVFDVPDLELLKSAKKFIYNKHCLGAISRRE